MNTLVEIIIVEFLVILVAVLGAAVAVWKFRRDAGRAIEREKALKQLLQQYEAEKYAAGGVDKAAAPEAVAK